MTQTVDSQLSRLVLCSIALGLLGSCSANAEIPEVVITQKNIEFDGVPLEGSSTTASALATAFDHPDGFEMPDFLTTRLYPLGAVVVAGDPELDLSFIETFSLVIASRTEPDLGSVTVASYTRGESTDLVQRMDISADSDADILKFWRSESAYYTLHVFGALPEDPWDVEVSVKFSGSLKIESQ